MQSGRWAAGLQDTSTSFVPKMEKSGSSEMLVPIYPAHGVTSRNTLIFIHYCKNLESHLVKLVF
jgi:hypothetical protein